MNNEASWDDTATRSPDLERATACPVALVQRHPLRTLKGVRQQVIGEVRVRNVAEKRGVDGHEAHIEVGIETRYETRSIYAGASFAIGVDDAIDFAAALLGVNRDVVVSMVEGIHG